MAHRSTLTDLEPADIASEAVDENISKHEKTCISCNKSLGGPFTKKYRCKHCYHAVCNSCSAGRLFSEKKGTMVRACNNCMRAQQGEKVELSVKEAEIEELRKMLLERDQDLAKELAEKSELFGKLEKLTGYSQKLEVDLEALRGGAGSGSDEMALKLDKKKEKVKSLKGEVQRLAEELEKVKEQLTTEKEQEKASLASQMAALTSKLTKKKDQKTSLKTQVESEQQAKVALMDLHSALESEKGNLQAKLERKKARKEAMKVALQEESRAKEELKLHKEKLEGDFEALRQQLDSRDTDRAALRQQFEAIAAELAQVKADEERQAQALTEAKDQVTTLTQVNEDLQQQLASSHLKVAKKKNKVATLKTKIGDLESSVARIEQERNELRDNISHLKHTLEGQGKAELQRVLEEKEQYASEIAQLRQSLSESSAKSAALEEKAESLAARVASFGEFDRAKNEQLQTLKQENAELQGELATLMGLNSADEIQVLRHEIEAKNLRISNLEAKLQEPERGNMPPTEQHQACLKCSMF